MFNVPMRSAGSLDRQTILSINQIHVQGPITSQNISTLAAASPTPAHTPSNTQQHPAPNNNPIQPAPAKPAPPLVNVLQKGQKVPLGAPGKLTQINACLGWNTTDAACDVDVSAFLLDSTGKVLGDSWFVFYGQERSPDGSTAFLIDQGADREIISIDLTRLNKSVAKIVFVLTIDGALKKHLDFSMIKDAYIRLIDLPSNRELASFKIIEYYPNIISMMIGEIYQHNGTWKFNAIGNGVAKDLAGLCRSYGVEVI